MKTDKNTSPKWVETGYGTVWQPSYSLASKILVAIAKVYDCIKRRKHKKSR